MASDEPEIKLFTVDEANALLPSVKKIVGRIQRTHKALSRYRGAAKKAPRQRSMAAVGSLQVYITPLSYLS
jgi:hypothetical protein